MVCLIRLKKNAYINDFKCYMSRALIITIPFIDRVSCIYSIMSYDCYECYTLDIHLELNHHKRFKFIKLNVFKVEVGNEEKFTPWTSNRRIHST